MTLPFIKLNDGTIVHVRMGKRGATLTERDIKAIEEVRDALYAEKPMILERKVTVCDNCLQASCWQGIFMCDKSRGAGTVEKTVGELHELALENPEYWFKSVHTGAIDQHGLGRYLDKTGKVEKLRRSRKPPA